MKKFLLLSLAALLVLSFAGGVFAQEAEFAKEGDPLPEFTLPNALAEGDVTSKDISGTKGLVAMVFMNTGCSACLAEIKEVSETVDNVGADKVTAYAIAVDKRGKAVVESYNSTYGFKVTYLLDPSFTIPPMFGFSYTPAIVLAKDGNFFLFEEGETFVYRVNLDTLEQVGVELGSRVGQWQVVLQGIRADDVIVTRDVAALSHGQKVTVKQGDTDLVADKQD